MDKENRIPNICWSNSKVECKAKCDEHMGVLKDWDESLNLDCKIMLDLSLLKDSFDAN